MYDIIYVGVICADIVLDNVKKIPQTGKMELVDDIRIYSGGNASNAAIDTARLGMKTAIIGTIGQDYFGKYMLTELEKHNVDISEVVINYDKNTCTCVVFIDNEGERTFLHSRGVNEDFNIKVIDLEFLKKTKVLCVSGTFLMPSFDGEGQKILFKTAHKLNLITAMDTCWDPENRWLSVIEKSLPYIDIFLPSYGEAKMISGLSHPLEMCKFLNKKGAKIVVIKLGEKGCYIYCNGEGRLVPGYKVKVKDTTGAGDSFVAGFLTAYVKGWPLIKCAEFANAVGANCVMNVGATTGVKTIRETINFMESKKILLKGD